MEGHQSQDLSKYDKRRRTGCLTCRSRRVKCDEEKPTCNRCRAANFYCEGYEVPRKTTNPSYRAASLTRLNNPPTEALVPALPLRHSNWRQEQLPFYHHFITSTAVRLFWTGHVGFWRDQVVQMSYGVDAVYEVVLAIGAVHRAALLSSSNSNGDFQEVARCKVLGLSLYGRVLRLLASDLLFNSTADPQVVLVVLLLCVYFECFMNNAKAAFSHLSAAIQFLQKSQRQLSDITLSNMVPVYETILRLDTLANMLVPYTNASHLYSSNLASTEHPFWNRQLREYWKRQPVESSKASESDGITIERGRLIELLTSHYNLSRLIWGCWQSERPSRDELLGICDELLLWKATSPAIFTSCSGLTDNYTDFATVPLPPEPLRFPSPGAALTVLMFNGYLSCALSMIAATDEDPFGRENESFKLTYQSLRISAGLMNDGNGQHLSSFKSCDAWNPGISIILFHAARRCSSPMWQLWIITALYSIGREGLCNGHAFANTLEIMRQLEVISPFKSSNESNVTGEESPLGPIHKRIIPVLMPHENGSDFEAYFLRCSQLKSGNRVVYVVAHATWKPTESNKIGDLKLHTYKQADAGADCRVNLDSLKQI